MRLKRATAPPGYTVVDIDDISYLAVKRYRVRAVITADGFPDEVMAAFLKDVRGRVVHATPQAKKMMKRTKPQIIFFFLYDSVDQAKVGNWYARGQWVHESLDPVLRPEPYRKDLTVAGATIELRGR